MADLTKYQLDVRAFGAALNAFPELEPSESNYLRVRQKLVADRKIAPGQMPVSIDGYRAVLAEMRFELEVKAKPVDPRSQMGRLFGPEDDEPARATADLPTGNDPFEIQKRAEISKSWDERFAGVYGRALSPAEKAMEMKRQDFERDILPAGFKDENETVYRGNRVSRGETATRRAENKRFNDALRANAVQAK